MGDFGLDTTHFATSLGCAWEAMPMPEYLGRAEKAPQVEVDKLVKEYRAAYEVQADATEKDMADTARAEIALRGMVRDYRLDACSYQFLSFGDDNRTATLPFVAACRMLADGIGFGGEGDVISAAYSAFTSWLQPLATFSEIFSIDFGGNTVLLSHMGEANVAMARKNRKPSMVRASAAIVPITGSQMGLVFGFQPGPATLTALTLVDGQRWRIIASPMTIEDSGPLPKLALPQAQARPAGDIRDFLTGYACAGGPHHSALCLGDARRQLKIAARYLDADYVEV
jgi:L-arabinose isomerase